MLNISFALSLNSIGCSTFPVYTYILTPGDRWNHSKTTVSRTLKKFEEMNFITLVSFTGRHGSMIYLNDYLSVMFDISDVMIDKEEIAMTMQLPIHIPENKEELCVSDVVKEAFQKMIRAFRNRTCSLSSKKSQQADLAAHYGQSEYE